MKSNICQHTDFHPLLHSGSQDSAASNPAKRAFSTIFNAIVDDSDEKELKDPSKIKKIFCSQSIVLMLRYGLDPKGRHAALHQALHAVKSRLMSPKHVRDMLVAHGAVDLENEQLAAMAGLGGA